MSEGAAGGADARRSGNIRAMAALVAGLLAVGTMPLAIGATRFSDAYDLVHAGFAIPLGLLFGCLALGLTRSARRYDDLRLLRAGGRGTARVAWALGVLGIALAATALVALAVYAFLTYLGER